MSDKSIRIDGKIAQDLKKFSANNGVTIKFAVEFASKWLMDKGVKELLKSIKE